jgi:hypothetical protein
VPVVLTFSCGNVDEATSADLIREALWVLRLGADFVQAIYIRCVPHSTLTKAIKLELDADMVLENPTQWASVVNIIDSSGGQALLDSRFKGFYGTANASAGGRDYDLLAVPFFSMQDKADNCGQHCINNLLGGQLVDHEMVMDFRRELAESNCPQHDKLRPTKRQRTSRTKATKMLRERYWDKDKHKGMSMDFVQALLLKVSSHDEHEVGLKWDTQNIEHPDTTCGYLLVFAPNTVICRQHHLSYEVEHYVSARANWAPAQAGGVAIKWWLFDSLTPLATAYGLSDDEFTAAIHAAEAVVTVPHIRQEVWR